MSDLSPFCMLRARDVTMIRALIIGREDVPES